MIYLDSSALVKLYADEDGAEEARQWPGAMVMTDRLKRGVSSLSARNSTLPNRRPVPGGTTKDGLYRQEGQVTDANRYRRDSRQLGGIGDPRRNE